MNIETILTTALIYLGFISDFLLVLFALYIIIRKHPRRPSLYTNKITLFVCAAGIFAIMKLVGGYAAVNSVNSFGGTHRFTVEPLPSFILSLLITALPVVCFIFFRNLIVHYIFGKIGYVLVSLVYISVAQQNLSTPMLLDLGLYLFYGAFCWWYFAKYFNFSMKDLKKLKVPAQ